MVIALIVISVWAVLTLGIIRANHVASKRREREDMNAEFQRVIRQCFE